MSFGAARPRSSVDTSQRPDSQAESHVQQISSRDFSPGPSINILGELQQLRSLAEATRAHVSNLEALLEPAALAQITDTKRLMRDAHRGLERLQEQTRDAESSALVSDAAVETWQVYQRLVRIEEKLRRAVDDMPEAETAHSATTGSQSPTHSRHGRHYNRSSIERASLTSDTRPVTEEENAQRREGTEPSSNSPPRLYAWPSTQWWEKHSEQALPGGSRAPAPASPTATENEPQMSGFSKSPYTGRISGRTGALSAVATPGVSPGSSGDLRALNPLTVSPSEMSSGTHSGVHGEERDPDSADELRALYLQHGLEALPSKLAKTHGEVLYISRAEESNGNIELYDPDRKREGSIPGFFATYVLLAGIDDPNICLPPLNFIKVHEVKRLKEWLVQKHNLTRSGEVSRIEKVLHLIMVLQEGCRIEVCAVWFSRTPHQVFESCRDVFNSLLDMHCETFLEYYQPTCHYLWWIASKFMNKTHSWGWELHYHWTKQELFNVLVTLNMFIGRYRKQGKVALDGPYQHWWRHFANLLPQPTEPTE